MIRTLIFLLICGMCFADITVSKVLDAWDEHNDGKYTFKVVLTDGVDSRLSLFAGLPDNTAQGIAIIEGRPDLQSIFDRSMPIKKAENVQTPAKEFLDELPNMQDALDAVDGAWPAGSQRVIMRKLVKCIYALKEAQQ